VLYIMEDNKYGHVMGVFTSLESLAKAVAGLPPGERMVDLISIPPDTVDPGTWMDLDELPPETPGAWWMEED
jgi:hypothetical protein